MRILFKESQVSSQFKHCSLNKNLFLVSSEYLIEEG